MWMVALFAAGFLIPRRVRSAADGSLLEPATWWRVLLCCSVLVSTFWAELIVIRVAAETQLPFPPWFARLPLLLIDENPPLYGHTPPWVGNDLALIAIAQSAGLYALFRALRRRRTTVGSGAILIVSFSIMLVAALSSRAMSAGIDLYLNVGFAHLGLEAYRPPNRPFGGEFELINRLWGTPIIPAVYGPLWLLITTVVAKCAHTLGGQLQAFRILGALSLITCLGLLRAIRAPVSALALFAVNPVLVFQYVVDAHNDSIPLVFALGAVALARRTPWLALLCAVAAGSMKFPFGLAAMLAFSQLDDRRKGAAFAVLSIALAGDVTLLLSGGAYFSALGVPLAYQALANFGFRFAHLIAIAAAVSATALAIWARRFLPTGAWTYLALGAVTLPWYAAWGLPYAVLEGTFLPVYLVTLPILAYDLSTSFGITLAARLLFLLVVCTPLILLLDRKSLKSVTA